jgi:N-acyl-D-aspartate/D-glutamate deacylase
VLRRYVREKKALSLEAAVMRMTLLPAERLRLGKRGRLAPGFAADLVVFDPETVADVSTFHVPSAPPAGIVHVMIGGRFAVRDGKVTGVRAGQILRPAQ